MTDSVADFPVDELTVNERLDLLARLWDSLLRPDQPPPMPEWHREELSRRIAAADANPHANVSLDELRKLLSVTAEKQEAFQLP